VDIRNISRVNVGARSRVSNANTEGLGTRFMSFLFMSVAFHGRSTSSLSTGSSGVWRKAAAFRTLHLTCRHTRLPTVLETNCFGIRSWIWGSDMQRTRRRSFAHDTYREPHYWIEERITFLAMSAHMINE